MVLPGGEEERWKGQPNKHVLVFSILGREWAAHLFILTADSLLVNESLAAAKDSREKVNHSSKYLIITIPNNCVVKASGNEKAK